MRLRGPSRLLIVAALIVWPCLLKGEELPPSATPSGDRARHEAKYNYPSRHYIRPNPDSWHRVRFQVQSTFSSRYVWNGIPCSRGPVWQPNASLEYRGFGFSVNGNFVLNDEPNQGQFNEVDFTGYYGISIKKWVLEVSVSGSVFPNADPASLNFSEANMGANLHLAYPAGPLDLFTDFSIWFFEPAAGVFWELGIGYQRKLPLKFSIATSASFGLANGRYNESFLGPEIGTGPSVFSYSLSFPWNPWKGFYVTPQFNVSTLLTDAARDSVPFPTNVWGDLTLGYSF